jgi:hypothetical protein
MRETDEDTGAGGDDATHFESKLLKIQFVPPPLRELQAAAEGDGGSASAGKGTHRGSDGIRHDLALLLFGCLLFELIGG